MKSKRRHELQENTLAHEFGKLKQFFARWGNHITWGVLIAAVIFAIGFYAYRSHRRRRQELVVRISRVQTVQLSRDEQIAELRDLAAQRDKLRVAAQASVLLGDAYYFRHVFDREDDEMTPEEREQLARQSEDAYRRVINDFQDFPRHVARAHYGLAKLMETQGRFDEARERYRTVLEMDGLEGDPVVTLARNELERVDELTRPVEFADVPLEDVPAEPLIDPSLLTEDPPLEPGVPPAPVDPDPAVPSELPPDVTPEYPPEPEPVPVPQPVEP